MENTQTQTRNPPLSFRPTDEQAERFEMLKAMLGRSASQILSQAVDLLLHGYEAQLSEYESDWRELQAKAETLRVSTDELRAFAALALRGEGE